MSRIGRPRKFGRISSDDTQVENTFDSRQEQGNYHATTCVMNTPEMSVDSGSRGMDSNNIVVLQAAKPKKPTHPNSKGRKSLEAGGRLLYQTIQLEQSLVISPSPPPTDLMLKAESNFRALNHSISTWKGHGQDVRDCRTIAGISFPLANNSAEIKNPKVLIPLDPQRETAGVSVN
ncbi:hypothetical protein AJ78_08634 [Emergomyces pasteurianus Ep9510]|uniref:Uncharacterized protein n=1 Tax=Emergomyces pasteurianus Ep9510 TaxID=1447872 RepID=A0A1J9Q304_9EURO|nr:hypothetical protein AJ78_08634 [Emergomyces pasteurianus Ep9510]